jgi:hypothetical protein
LMISKSAKRRFPGLASVATADLQTSDRLSCSRTQQQSFSINVGQRWCPSSGGSVHSKIYQTRPTRQGLVRRPQWHVADGRARLCRKWESTVKRGQCALAAAAHGS